MKLPVTPLTQSTPSTHVRLHAQSLTSLRLRVDGLSPESRRDQEVVLDPQVSPEEIKSREVQLGLRVRPLSLQLFPNGGATDIVFVTVPHSSWDSNCLVH